MSSAYGHNVIAINGARRVTEHLNNSDYVTRKLDELIQETGSMDLDDQTSRQIVKFQARMLVAGMFEKVQMALNSITVEDIELASLKDRTTFMIGTIGRIETLMNIMHKISEQDGSEMDQFVQKLRTMERSEALIFLRNEFQALLGHLFTDDERAQVFQDLESQVALGLLGSDDGNVRSVGAGEEVGSSRWVPRSGPPGVLPPPCRTD